MGDSGGFAGPGTPAVQDALRLSLNWHSGGPEGPAQIQAVINAVMAVSAGLRAPRPGVPDRHRVDGAGQRRSCRHRGRDRRHRRTVPMVVAVPRVLRRELARTERATPLPRVRHDARADGPDRAQCASQRGVQPEGDLPSPDVDRRLLRRSHHHDAVLPLRLRRAGRRLDRGGRVASPSTRRRSTIRSRASKRSERRSGAGRRGTSGTT